jgi:hypothetical protein
MPTRDEDLFDIDFATNEFSCRGNLPPSEFSDVGRCELVDHFEWNPGQSDEKDCSNAITEVGHA